MNPGWMKVPTVAWKLGAVIPEDANVVSHVYWRGGALVDSVGTNSWTQNGTVPQVGANGYTPPGAGPFSDANYYSLGAGADVLDFTDDFSAAVLFYPGGANKALYSNGTWASTGFILFSSSGTFQFWVNATARSASGAAVAGTPNLLCFGKSGGSTVVKCNLQAANTGGVIATTAGTAAPAMLGRGQSASYSFDGTLYEAYFSSTAASDATFTAMATAVKSALKISAW